MSNTAVNITPEASTNLTSSEFYEITFLEVYVLGFNFMIGLPTHIYVIWLILTGRGNGVPSEFFILNHSVCGLFFSVNALLLFFTKWFMFPILITFYQVSMGFVITGSPVFQCLICVERYLAVVHPVTFLKYKPLRYKVICCTVAWIITLGSCLVCKFIFLLSNVLMYMWFLSLQYLLLLSIQLFCCVAVLRALKQSGPGEKVREREDENHKMRKAFYLILITTVSTVLTYVPFTVTGLVSTQTGQSPLILWSFSFICFTLANFVPPILFLHRIGNIFCLRICNMKS